MAGQGASIEVIAAGPGARSDGAISIERVGARNLFYGGGAPEALEASWRAWASVPPFVARFAALLARRARHWDAIVSHLLAPSGLLGALFARVRSPVALALSGDLHLLYQLSVSAL